MKINTPMGTSKKIYTTPLIFSLLSLILFIFFIWPLSKEIKNNSNDLISAKNDIVALDAQAVETENFKKNYQTYKPNLEKIELSFFNPNSPVNFIKYLESTALASRINLKIFSPSLPAGSQQGAQDYTIFQFMTNGSFTDVSNFLKKIEIGPYLIETTNLTIQNSQESEKDIPRDYSTRMVSATFTIKVFTKK